MPASLFDTKSELLPYKQCVKLKLSDAELLTKQ
jgi:hypothetical protein